MLVPSDLRSVPVILTISCVSRRRKLRRLERAEGHSGIIPVGVRVKRRNYWEVEGVWYGDNIFAALEHILELEQPYLR